ncbi:Hypothetical predicted protein [Olea europaea subsp. europaea]|uniref:DUF1985 domain-containing protein n=1 Tax=Olea europaea subsp. europaea TaxID=158383 RepID=A0A8S0SP27_OLEEU|nr:Hypothetical predicted protein [Olea europaea subsp. europaea]
MWVHISQRSNLKYVKTVMDHFDERQCEDFRNFSLDYLAEGDDFDRLLERRRLKERYFKSNDKISLAQLQSIVARSSTNRADRYKLGLVLIVEGVFNVSDNNVDIHLPTLSIVDDLDFFFTYPWDRVTYRRLLHGFRGSFERKFQKAKKRKEITYTVYGFPIAMQVWAYEMILEIGERISQRVGDRMPRLFRWSTRKQPQHHTYDAFFRNVQYDNPQCLCSMTLLGLFLRRILIHPTPVVELVDSREGKIWMTECLLEEVVRMRHPEMMTATGSQEVIAMTTTVRIVIVMTVRILHVTFQCTRLREFIAAYVAPPTPTTIPSMIVPIFEAGISGSLPQDGAHVAPYPDDVHEPLPTSIDDLQDGGRNQPHMAMPDLNDGAVTEPSHVVGVSDVELDGCNVMNGEGVVAKVPVPTPVPEVGGKVTMTRRLSAWLQRPTPAMRTHTRGGRGKRIKK